TTSRPGSSRGPPRGAPRPFLILFRGARQPMQQNLRRYSPVAVLIALLGTLWGCGSSSSSSSTLPTAVTGGPPVNLPAQATPGAPPARPPTPPVLGMHTDPPPASGSAPLTVNFNLCHSYDPDGDALTYVYTFGDGKTRTISFCRHEHTYASRGTYSAS